jgi:hypothetical protein
MNGDYCIRFYPLNPRHPRSIFLVRLLSVILKINRNDSNKKKDIHLNILFSFLLIEL